MRRGREEIQLGIFAATLNSDLRFSCRSGSRLAFTTFSPYLQYFKNSLNTRLSMVYIETWKEQNQAAGFGRLRNINQALADFSEYVGTRLYKVDKDTTQLLT